MDGQIAFFNQIKKSLKKQESLSKVVSEVLDIALDSAYRRIRGEKALTFPEIKKLSSHYNISLDAILNKRYLNTDFIYAPLSEDIMRNYVSYVEYVTITFESLLESKQREILQTAQDIPLFHFTAYPDLSFFNLYVYHQSLTDNKPVPFEDFFSAIDATDKTKLINYYERISIAYRQIPSKEIWTNSSIDSIINLIDYYADMDCFKDRATPVRLCRQLIALTDSIEFQTRRCIKEHNGNKYSFGFYLSSLNMQNNLTLLSQNGTHLTMIKLFSLNGLFSSNECFCTDTDKWIQGLLSKSQQLSGVSARERAMFFHLLKDKINCLMDKFA